MLRNNTYFVNGPLTTLLVRSPKHGLHLVRLDTEDLPKVRFSRWCVYKNYDGAKARSEGRGRLYVGTPQRKAALHRVLVNAPEGVPVDHINGRTLDNRKRNLRLVNASQNAQNRKGPNRNTTSGVRGVTFDKARQKWAAAVTLNRKRYALGRYATKEDAERAAISGRQRLMTHSSECTAAA